MADAIGREFPFMRDALAQLDPRMVIAAVLLLLLVFVLIRIGRALFMAAFLGAITWGISWRLGNGAGGAGTHAVMGFGVAALWLLLVGPATRALRWLLITAAGVAALLFWGMGTS